MGQRKGCDPKRVGSHLDIKMLLQMVDSHKSSVQYQISRKNMGKCLYGGQGHGMKGKPENEADVI